MEKTRMSLPVGAGAKPFTSLNLTKGTGRNSNANIHRTTETSDSVVRIHALNFSAQHSRFDSKQSRLLRGSKCSVATGSSSKPILTDSRKMKRAKRRILGKLDDESFQQLLLKTLATDLDQVPVTLKELPQESKARKTILAARRHKHKASRSTSRAC